MTPAEIIAVVRAQGATIDMFEGKIRCAGPARVLTQAIQAEILANRDAILEILQRQASPPVVDRPEVPTPSAAPTRPRSAESSRDALFGTGFILDVVSKYRATFGTPDESMKLLERVSGCDVLRGHVTVDDLRKLDAYLDEVRAAKRGDHADVPARIPFEASGVTS